MAGRSAQTPIQMQKLRAHILHARAKRGRADPALLLAAALRARMRRIGPPKSGGGLEQPFLAQCDSYALRVGHREIPWSRAQPVIRAALEADLPPDKRSQAARDLAAYLHAERPTRVQAALARPLLVEIWRNLNRN